MCEGGNRLMHVENKWRDTGASPSRRLRPLMARHPAPFPSDGNLYHFIEHLSLTLRSYGASHQHLLSTEFVTIRVRSALYVPISTIRDRFLPSWLPTSCRFCRFIVTLRFVLL